MKDGKFVSIMTNTFASEITYEDWKKKIEKFFFADERIIMLLKQNGMTKYTIYKTDDVEPVKSITIFEYSTKASFDKCQKIFLKFMPKIQNMIVKVNIVRGNTIFNKI